MNLFERRLTDLERRMMPPPSLTVDKSGDDERWYYGCSRLVKWIKGVSYEDI